MIIIFVCCLFYQKKIYLLVLLYFSFSFMIVRNLMIIECVNPSVNII